MSQLKPRCRLYLQVVAPFTAKQESLLSQALSAFSPACVLIRLGTEPADNTLLDSLVDNIQGAGAACLIEDNVEASADLGADGVHILADETLYQTARKALGESANIGVACGLSRHEAMELAESGADYVAFNTPGQGDREDEFGRLSETVAWWSEIFVVPCVAWNIADRAEAVALTKLGVDFIAPPTTIWDRDDALEALGEIDQAIGSIRREA
ncbi:MAG: thiamine phosphate synthase [Methyloceanibacter sp.]|nr:thiamine phosphate synthase [Methyloceanibacter sp.]